MVQRFQTGNANKEPELQKEKFVNLRMTHVHVPVILPASQHQSIL